MSKNKDVDSVANIKPISSFEGLKTEKAKVEKMCDVLESLPFGISIPSRISDNDTQYAVGHTKDKIIRIEIKGGITVHDLASEDGEEEGYVYENPENAIAWLACKLGYGSNYTNFETHVITVQPEGSQQKIRLSFEKPLSKSQLDFYKSMGTFGFKVDGDNSGKRKGNGGSSKRQFGHCVLSELKVKN